MEYYLDYLLRFVEEMRATNSRILKEEILDKWYKNELELQKKYPQCNDLNKLFHYVYDYDKQYYVTSTNVLKKNLIQEGVFVGKKYSLIWDLLDDLSNRVITGHNAIIAVQQFLKQEPKDCHELILNIIDKDLKCGLSEVTINKVCGNIIKTYNVALADKFNPKKHILTSDWVIERKLDGCLHYDTLIETNKGKLKIGDIVNNKIKCKVLTFNHDKQIIQYKSIKNYLKNFGEDQTWYEITTFDEKKLIVTGNHKIFVPTLNIYRRADELLEGDEVVIVE